MQAAKKMMGSFFPSFLLTGFYCLNQKSPLQGSRFSCKIKFLLARFIRIARNIMPALFGLIQRRKWPSFKDHVPFEFSAVEK